MPPVHPPLKNDGPACRVCGCTEHNACLTEGHVFDDVPCSWVLTKGADKGPLCSACAGTAGDLAEAIKRARSELSWMGKPEQHPERRKKARGLLGAALTRYRKKEVDAAA